VIRPVARAVVLILLAACSELPLPPELEAGREPGAAIYTASGPMEGAGRPATGTATYVLDAAGRAALSLSADFSIPPVPDVFVLLSDNGRYDDAVKVADLGEAGGPKRWTFKVPRGAVWRWVILWSEALDVEVARAHLEP
jgi:hypothetical protein